MLYQTTTVIYFYVIAIKMIYSEIKGKRFTVVSSY